MTDRQIRNRAGRTHEICKRHQCAATHAARAIRVLLGNWHLGRDALAADGEQSHAERLRHPAAQHNFMCAVRRRFSGTRVVGSRLLRGTGQTADDSFPGNAALLRVFRSILRHLRLLGSFG